MATKSRASVRAAARTPSTPSPMSPARWLVLGALAALTVAVFYGVLHNGWVRLDDPAYVLDNVHVNRGWSFADALWFLSHAHGGNWHPLTSWSHMLDVQLFGLAAAGPHAVNLALHVANALLLAWVLFRLTGAWWRSVLVAALFALHPLRVESVAWASERKDVLSGCFFLLTIEAYRRWAAEPSARRYAFVAASLALGLMAKSMLVTLPCVLVLLDIWPLGRLAPAVGSRAGRAPALSLWGLIAEKWRLFALSAASIAATIAAQKATGAVVASTDLTLTSRVGNALLSYWRYVGMTAWPANLAPLYPLPHTANLDVRWAPVAALALAGVSVLAFRQARQRPWLLVGWLWYVGTLVPVIGFLQVGMQAYADRYTYLPAIGLLVALVWGLGELVGSAQPRRIAAAVAAALALAALAAATVMQVPLWKDTRTLFTHTLAVTHDNAIAENVIGWDDLMSGQAKPALAHFAAAVRVIPDLPDANEGMGEALMALNHFAESIPYFETVLRVMPDLASAHTNLGAACASLNRNDEAIGHFRAALRLGETADLHLNLGHALAVQGHGGEAIAEYEAALRLKPGDHGALVQLAVTLVSAGRLDDAEARAREALRLAANADETQEAEYCLQQIAARRSGKPGR